MYFELEWIWSAMVRLFKKPSHLNAKSSLRIAEFERVEFHDMLKNLGETQASCKVLFYHLIIWQRTTRTFKNADSLFLSNINLEIKKYIKLLDWRIDIAETPSFLFILRVYSMHSIFR